MKKIPPQRLSEEIADFPLTKKRKTYAMAIAMQKTTFLGLKNISNIAKYVDAHLSQLQFLANNESEYIWYLIKEIELNLSNYIDRDIVKLTLKYNVDKP